jgi:flagellar motor switch protein FliG
MKESIMSERKLSGIEKAAILLKSLPPGVVEKVLRHMNAQQAESLRSELVRATERNDLKELTASVLSEAAKVMTSSREKKADAPGAVDVRIGASALEPTSSTSNAGGTPSKPAPKDAASKATPTTPSVEIRLASMEEDSDPLVAIAKMPADLLAQALENETTRTISLLMNYLEIEIAGQIYKRLTPAKRKEVSMRFTEQATIDDGLLRRIAHAVLKKCESLRATAVTGAVDPATREKRMASLLRGLERAERMEMLGVLEQSDAELAGRIKSMLYQFEDVLRLQNISVQKLLTQVDTKSLAQALSGASPELRDKLFTNLSKRAQEALKEEIELAGTVPSAKVRPAQQAIADAIQGLDQRGELLMIE